MFILTLSANKEIQIFHTCSDAYLAVMVFGRATYQMTDVVSSYIAGYPSGLNNTRSMRLHKASDHTLNRCQLRRSERMGQVVLRKLQIDDFQSYLTELSMAALRVHALDQP